MAQERINLGPSQLNLTALSQPPGVTQDCRPISQMLGRIGDKWTIMTISMLLDGPRRFNELRRLIGGISQQMLTRTLRALETDGLVLRKVHPTIPPQVEYRLSPLGQSLSVPLVHLVSWVLDNMAEIERNRLSGDAVDEFERKASD